MTNLENNKDNNEKLIKNHLRKSVDKPEEKDSNLIKEEEYFQQDAVKEVIEESSYYRKRWKKMLIYPFYIVLSIVGLIFITISLPVTKNWVATKALDFLNQDFGIEISKKNISCNMFGDITIDGIEIKDHKGYPFIKAVEYRAKLDLFSLLNLGKTNSLVFESMVLKNADIKVITYKGDSIDNFSRFISKFDDDQPRNPKKPIFRFHSRVQILDSKITILNQNYTGDQSKWLTADHFNLTVPILKIKGSDVSARINNMTFYTYRWGKKYFVETFSTDFSSTKETLKFKDLILNTDHSLLMGELTIHLDKKTNFSDFANKVVLDLNLKKGTQISGYDISYFVNNWDNYIPVNVSGKMEGSLNKFTLKNLLVSSQNIKIHTSKIQIKDILNGSFHIKTNYLVTDFIYSELRAMFPKFISEKMGDFADAFKNIKFSGQVDVDPNQLMARGNLITGIGQAEIKALTLFDFRAKEPKYRGNIIVKDFNVSAFTKDKDVGLLTGNIDIQGQGFDMNTLSLQTRSEIYRVQIMGKYVNNLSLYGRYTKKKYDGLIVINNDQAKVNIKGLIDFSSKALCADIKSEIEYLNLNYFNKNINTIVSGIFIGKASMTNINDLSLNVNLENMKFASADQKFEIPNVNVKVFLEKGNRIIDIDAPGAIQGKIVGHYNLSYLEEIMKSSLGNVLVGYSPKRSYKDQDFYMEFNIQQKLVSYFFPDVYISNRLHFKGSYKGNTNDLIVDANIPSFKYLMKKKREIKEADIELSKLNSKYKINENPVLIDSIIADSMYIKINTELSHQQIVANIKRVNYSKYSIKDISLKGNNEDGVLLRISSLFKIGKISRNGTLGNFKEYAINLEQSTDANGDIKVKFAPTSINLDKDTWNIDTSSELNHSIVYRKKKGEVQVNNLRIYSDESTILVNGTFKGSKDFNTEVIVHKLQLEKVLVFFPGENSMDIQGVANGFARIKISENDLQPIIDLNINKVKIGSQNIGNLILNTRNSSKNIYDIDACVTSSGILGENNLHLIGTINNNTTSPTLDLKVSLIDFNVSFIGEFVKTIFTNLRGKANGSLHIRGPLNNIDYSGSIAMTGIGFKFIFTGVDYTFSDSVIPVSKGLILLDGFKIHDGRHKSLGSIAGAVSFEKISSIGLDLVIQADDLLLLNTSQKDFDTFWGRVSSKGIINISGPISKLNIDAKAAILSGSEFTLNTNTTASVEEFKMLRFLQVDEKTGKISIEQESNSGTNMNIGLILDIDKNSTVNVLLGDNVGNISVRGIANSLRFNMNRAGIMNINGVYSVDNGTFVSKAILEKKFQIEKGSNISWDGNVMNPDLNIVANYYRVVTNLGEYLNVGKLQPTNVQLQIKIKNKMQELNHQGAIVMGIILPEASSQIKEALTSKINTEDEKIKQIGSILIMNSFNVTSLDGLSIGNAAVSTGYNMLFKNLSSVFNTISNDFHIDMDYIKGDQGSNTADRANTNININLSPRIKVKTGIGIPITKTDNIQVNYLSGQGSIEYDVSRSNDRSLLLHAYSKPANIGLVTTSNASDNQSYGTGFSYTKSFNKFKELFGKKKNKNKVNDKLVQDSIRK